MCSVDPEDDFFRTATPLRYMQKPIANLKSHNSESGSNSTYEAPEVNTDDIELWDNFLGEEIPRMIDNPRWNKVLTSPFTIGELRKFIWDEPDAGGNINEQTFELLWQQIVVALNLIHKRCASADQNTCDPCRIIIGNGCCAKKITTQPYRQYRVSQKSREKCVPNTKRPDYAGYLYKPGTNQYIKDGPEKV